MSSTLDTPAVSATPFPADWTFADLQEHLGGIPANRIHLYPTPGTATEADALWLDDHKDCICELVDGTLVEKDMSYYESILAMFLGQIMNNYLEKNNWGIVSGPDGQIRLLPAQMRVPDLAFINWNRFPDRKLPKDRVCRVAPDLAVDVCSHAMAVGDEVLHGVEAEMLEKSWCRPIGDGLAGRAGTQQSACGGCRAARAGG